LTDCFSILVPIQIDQSSDSDGSSNVNLSEQWLSYLHQGRSLSSSQIQQLSPVALAYLGDAVYELFFRSCYLFPPQRIQAFHRQVVAQVRAEAQANHLQTWLPHLTAAELEWVKRGRNAAVGRPRRVDAAVYQQATSLETLVGYLYLTDVPRLTDLLTLLKLDSDLPE
jgi:ribonuclease-3 family protein